MNMSLIERVERNIVRLPFSGCWIWMGATTQHGYGVISYSGKPAYVHRLLFEAITGDALGKRFACHRCDVPSCCNPSHIFAGTQLDNIRDMSRKGRGRKAWDVCGFGHVMDDENSYFSPSGIRQCRACKARRDRIYKQNRRMK